MNFTGLLMLLMGMPALQDSQSSFTRFTYCHDSVRGVYEMQCSSLAFDGTGEVRFKRRGLQEVQVPVNLSPEGRDKFRGLIAATNNLADAGKYETRKKVADLGRKRLTLDAPSGQKTAEFNYSDLKEVNALTTFFDALLNQHTMIFDLETALRFERLTVPEKLDHMENELRSSRIADPRGLIPILEKIESDDRVLEYARERAQQIKNKLAATKR